MIRSLSTRLLLAFALTSLVGIGMAALFVRQLVVTQFDAYLLDQQRSNFLSQVTSYYASNGSWVGISSALLFEREERRGNDHGMPASRRINFALADQAGVIVLAANASTQGQQADARALAAGSAVTVNGERVGTIVLTGPPPGRNPAEEGYLARTDLALSLAALAALTVAVSLGLLLARLITRPLRDLTEATRALAAGKLGEQVPVRSRDELGLLALQFNRMSSDLQRATELRRRLTADIAHDLRTPLTVIAGYLEALRDEALQPTPARFTAMYDESQILLRLVEDLHTLSLADAGELALKLQSVAPADLLARVAQTYNDVARQAGVMLSVSAAPALPSLRADAEQLVRALGNLVNNALRHTPAGGQVGLRAEQTPAGIVLTVTDTGEGIPAEHLSNIFERFYRADPSRQQATGGSGLGLAIVRSIVEAHGGEIVVASMPGAGSEFRLMLPIDTTKRALAV